MRQPARVAPTPPSPERQDEIRTALKIDLLRRQASAHAERLDYRQAIEAQLAAVNLGKMRGRLTVAHLAKVAGLFTAMGETATALGVWQECHRLAPTDELICEHYASTLAAAGHGQAAYAILQRFLDATAAASARARVYERLCDTAATLGETDAARAYGQQALRLKDKTMTALTPLPGKLALCRKPRFCRETPERNIIAFVLWGHRARYLQTALTNVSAAAQHFAGWRCRFYVDDSVPPSWLDRLRQAGAELVMRPRSTDFGGYFWRHEVCHDNRLDYFLLRNLNAPLTAEDGAAVAKWLDSPALFHIQRPSLGERCLIPPGHWGGVASVLPQQTEIWLRHQQGRLATAAIERWYLDEAVWPLIRPHHLADDPVFAFAPTG